MHKANAGKSPVYASFGSTRTVGTSVQSKLKQGEERGGGGRERGGGGEREARDPGEKELRETERERQTDGQTERGGGEA